MKNRIVALVLSLVLVLGCFTAVAGAEGETVHATALLYTSPGFTPAAESYGVDLIREEFGLDLEVLPVDVATTESWNIFFASGETADIIIPYGLTEALAIVDEDCCRPIDFEVLKENTPRLMSLLTTLYGGDEGIKSALNYRDEVWCVPYFAMTNAIAWVSAVRNDWLEAVGLGVPTTVAELGEVLRAFTFDDPDGNGVQDTYGCDSIQYGLFNVAAAFGTSEALAFWLADDGSAITTNAVSDEYKAFLKQIHEWYAAGYIDPEFVTDVGDRAAIRSKWASGKMGIYCDNPWWFEDGRGEIGPLRMLTDTDSSLDFSTSFSFFGPTVLNEGDQPAVSNLFSDIKGQASVYFGYDCPDEVVVKMMQLIDSRVRLYDGTAEDVEVGKLRARMDVGEEGTYWNWDETLNEAVSTDAYNALDAAAKAAMGLYVFPAAANMNLAKFEGQVDEFVIGCYNMSLGNNGEYLKIYRTNNFSKPGLSAEGSDKSDMVGTYFNECKNKFILGEMDLDADWDTYCATIESYGLNDIIAEYEASLGIAK